MKVPGGRRRIHISGRRPRVGGLPVEEDVHREVSFHLESRTEELIGQGWDPRAAREEAERLFGDARYIRRQCEGIMKGRDRLDWITLFLQGIVQDIRYAVRTLSHAPVFTGAAVLSLAIGIGAGTAIFSIVNAVLLRPLPYQEPDRLVQVWPGQAFTKSLLETFRDQTTVFDGLYGYSTQSFSLTGAGEATDMYGGYVSVNHFEILGADPLLGRAFSPGEREPGSPEVVILSYGLWQSRFGGDPGIVGRSIQLGGRGVNTRTVIGVMHPDYRPISELWQFWVPMQVDPSNFPDYEGTAFLTVAGRLTDDATVEQAHVEVTRIAKLLAEEQSWLRRDPDLLNRAGVIPLLTSVVGDARTPMLVFLGVVSLLLLLTCANLANILLARAGNRTREVAVRMALGAGRARIFRQMITESVVLGLAGGLAGLLVGIWLLSILKGNLPVGTPRTGGIGIDGTVLFFTAGISLLSAVLYGLAPSFSSTRKDVHINLQEGRTGISITRRRYRINSILVAAEVAISVLLLTGAGLLIRSVLALHRVDPGFDTRNMVTMRLNPPGTAYPDSAAIYNYYQSVIERVGILSGVQSVSSIYYLPLTMENIGMLYEAESHPVAEGEPMPGANVRVVGNDYFPTMGIPRLEGAVLSSARPEGTPFEIVVNSSLARLYWPEGEATGNHIEMNGVTWTVVGVVGDVRQFRLSMASQPEIYIHHGLSPARQMYLVVRTGIDAKDMIAPLRDAVWSIDDDVPLSFVRTMDEVVRRSMSESRIYAVLLTCFGLVAFILGVIGVFGVVSYTTGQRTREIGIRLALGAVRPRIVGEVVRRALLPVGIGIAVGLAGAVGASQVIAGMLYGVSATDPMTYAGVLLLQVIVALVACYLPANRAAGSDPMSVLRVE